MHIHIVITNENGEPQFTANCYTIESAVQELYRYERNKEKSDDVIV